MKYLHIDPSNKHDLEKFKQSIKSKTPTFVLFYMEGCGPCNATRPEWKKLESANLSNNCNVFDIDNSLLDNLKEFPKVSDVVGFPTMKFIRGESEVEDYTGGRTIDDFSKWIKSKCGSTNHSSSSLKKGGGKRTKGGGCGCSKFGGKKKKVTFKHKSKHSSKKTKTLRNNIGRKRKYDEMNFMITSMDATVPATIKRRRLI